MSDWSEDALRDDEFAVADIEEVKALTQRFNEMAAGDLAALRAEVAEIRGSPDSTPRQVSYATVMGAGCSALARGESPETVLTLLIKMRSAARDRTAALNGPPVH